jgi:flagellar motor switch protein FliN/FliY
MEKVAGSEESAEIVQNVGVLCDIELDATLQFGSREMPLRARSPCVRAGRSRGRR